MNRAKLLSQSLKLANSLTSSTRRPLTQVTHFSVLTQSSLVSLPKTPQIYGNSNILSNFHKVSFFSTKTEPFIDYVLSKNDWSQEIELDLEKLNPKLTHESIVHVLINLNKNPQKALDFFKWVCDTKGFEPNSVIYNLMLRTLVGKDMMEKFWEVAKEMKEKGFSISTKTYIDVHRSLLREKMGHLKSEWAGYYNSLKEKEDNDEVTKKVVEVISGSEWSEDVESELKGIEFPLSESFLVPVLRDLGKEPLKALKFFEWVGDCRGFEHNAVTYNELVKVLARAESMEECWEVVNSMKGKGYEVATDTYTKVWKYIPMKEAVALFEFMMDGPYKLKAKDCALIIKIIGLEVNPDMELVFRVVKKFEGAGNKLTRAIYGVVHRCLCKCGRFDEAEKIVETLVNDTGSEPDNIIYSQEIYGLCRYKRFDEAWKVLEKMQAQGCMPDVKTWTQLINGYCSADQFDQALLCLEKMKQQNLNPDADLIEILFKSFLAQNKVPDAYTFLSEMVEKPGVKPWQSTFKLMVEKLVEVGKLKEAVNVLHMMKKLDYPPFPVPFIHYISKYGSVDDAKEFLKAYPVNESSSTSCYINIIRGFLEEGRDQEAKDLLYRSPRRVRTHKAVNKLFGSPETSATSAPVEAVSTV